MWITYTAAATRKMAARDIPRKAIDAVVLEGEVIRAYPDDWPYPSALALGCPDGQPLHVVLP